MFKQSDADQPVRVGLFLVPNFSMIAFTCVVEPMRLANWLSGKTLFEWYTISRDGQPVISSNGLSVTADMAEQLYHWIGGEKVIGTSGRSGEVFNPATGEVIGTLPYASSADMKRWRCMSWCSRSGFQVGSNMRGRCAVRPWWRRTRNMSRRPA